MKILRKGKLKMNNERYDITETDYLDKNLFATASKLTNEKFKRIELVEEFKEELKNLNRIIDISVNKQPLSKYYIEYVRLGGQLKKKQFTKHLRRFFELTMNIFVYGSCLNIDGTYCNDREDAWEKWVLYIKNFDEADLYMEAVDSITPYT